MFTKIFKRRLYFISMEAPELMKAVIEMLARGESDEKIVAYLNEMGLKDEEAKDVLAVAKKKFAEFLDQRMRAVAEAVVKEVFEDFRKQWEKDMKTYLDLKVGDVKDEVSKEISDLRGELQATKESLTIFITSTQAKLDETFKMFEFLKVTPLTKKAMALGLWAFALLLLSLSFFLGLQPLLHSVAVGFLSMDILIAHLSVFFTLLFGAVGLTVGGIRIWGWMHG